jgi:AcrR family transcriptional regulator
VAEVKRRYHAPVRTEQAAQTRQRILQAAAEAFAQRGWAGTTIAEVAREAGVTAQAVHLSVGAKPALLISAIQRAAGGDEPDVPLIDREPFRHAYSAGADLHQRASAFAAGTRQVYQRAGRLFLVLAQTAGLDPELSALWDRARSARLQDCQRLVDLTGRRRRPLRDQLTDLLFVQSGPSVHADLVGDRRWSNDAYQRWLTGTIETLLACQQNASPSGPATQGGSHGPGADHDRARS